MQVAACVEIKTRLIPALKNLARHLQRKAKQWDTIVKIGRTHLMDATPIRLGQEFSGYAAQAGYAVQRAERAMASMAENMPIGGTAVGTGINTHPRFGKKVCPASQPSHRREVHRSRESLRGAGQRDCVRRTHRANSRPSPCR
jgi:fumarate hydratase class II